MKITKDQADLNTAALIYIGLSLVAIVFCVAIYAFWDAHKDGSSTCDILKPNDIARVKYKCDEGK